MSNTAAEEADVTNIDRVIGANVHTLIWRAGDTQTVVAPLWGMSQTALSLKLRGKRPWFAGEIDAAARRYGVTRDALFSRNMRIPDYELEGWANVIPISHYFVHPHNPHLGLPA